MRRHVVTTLMIWAALTAAGEAGLLTDMFPTVGSSDAADFDRIFRILFAIGIPVLAFVFAILATGLISFRTKGTPTTDGPAIFGRGAAPVVWLCVTSGLALSVTIYRGLTGLSKLESGSKTKAGWGDSDAELVINATGTRWFWTFEFPDAGVTLFGSGPKKEILLPVDTKIKFDITAIDVIHSLWVPAFRLRIDAVPGRHTFFTTEPMKLGEYSSDQAYRFQCSMLCGLDHSGMWNPIRVVPKEEFQTWLASQKKQGK